MTRFIRTTIGNDTPIYLRDDISAIFASVGVTPAGEISFYAPEEGLVMTLGHRGGRPLPVERFTAALAQGNNGFLRVPVYWSSEKLYAAAYIRPEEVTFLVASQPSALASRPGQQGVRVTLGVRGIGQVNTHALPLPDYSAIMDRLKTGRPDLLRLTAKEALGVPAAEAAAALVDPARIARIRISGERLSLFYSGTGTVELQKPPLARDAFAAQAVADDPANADPARLRKIWEDAQRIRAEDLESLARHLAARAGHLTEIAAKGAPYFTTAAAVSRLMESHHNGTHELTITYRRAFSPGAEPLIDTIAFDSPRQLEAAARRLTGDDPRGVPAALRPRL